MVFDKPGVYEITEYCVCLKHSYIELNAKRNGLENFVMVYVQQYHTDVFFAVNREG